MERFFIVFIFNHQIEFVSRRTVQLGIIEIISLRAQRTAMFTNRLDSRLWLTKVKSLHGIDGNSTRHRLANLTQLCAQSTMWHKTITVCCALRPSRSPSIACQAQQKKKVKMGDLLARTSDPNNGDAIFGCFFFFFLLLLARSLSITCSPSHQWHDMPEHAISPQTPALFWV